MPPTDDLATIRRRLLGGWTLHAWTITAGDGAAVQHPFGANPTGLIVYTDDGWMNASIARAGRAPLAAASPRQAPLAEQAEAFRSYFNYAGRYTLRRVDGAPHVVHAVAWSLNPGFVGSEQVRRVSFDGERDLVLSADESVGGGLRHHRLHWRRAAARTA